MRGVIEREEARGENAKGDESRERRAKVYIKRQPEDFRVSADT
jgi:hypothetical protein